MVQVMIYVDGNFNEVEAAATQAGLEIQKRFPRHGAIVGEFPLLKKQQELENIDGVSSVHGVCFWQ